MVKSLRKSDAPLILIMVKLDNCPVDMEVDTGAAISLVSESTFKALWPGWSFLTLICEASTYLQETIPVEGCTCANEDYDAQCVNYHWL